MISFREVSRLNYPILKPSVCILRFVQYGQTDKAFVKTIQTGVNIDEQFGQIDFGASTSLRIED